MRSSIVMTLIGAASLCAAVLAGCGDNDAKPVASKAGQSCVKTADCADGLSCIANVCYSSASGGGSGGAGGSAVVGPVLGGDGESCTSRKDCEDGLACFNQRCTTSTTGAGGETAAAPAAQLGERGETCRVNADCVKDLVCVPSTLSAGVGVCDITSFGIVPTGKTCGGECTTPSDCCQLPLSEATAEGVKDCHDLAALIALDEVDCTAAQPLNPKLCFLDATYCSGCTGTTWKCTDNACVYNVACAANAVSDNPKGCPSFSRLGRQLPTCNAKSLKCTGATAGACTTDASCVSLNIVDSNPTDSCTDGECTCYAGNHQCYRACARDLDCATGRVCDKDSNLCVPDTVCTTDAQCAEANQSLDFKCNMDTSTCARSCTTDRDCSGTGHLTGGGEAASFFNRTVCTDGWCTSVLGDCTDDSQCGTPGSYKTFCVDRPAITPDTSVSSAVTN